MSRTGLRNWSPKARSAEWREVSGTAGRYHVNEGGQLISAWNNALVQGRVQPSGHIRVRLALPRGGKRDYFLHQIVMEAFVGTCPDGQEIRHLDGNPANNALSNLAYGTKSENARDRRRHGTDANARKTHCKRGHPFDAANTRIRPDGSRKCRACDRQATRDRADRLDRDALGGERGDGA